MFKGIFLTTLANILFGFGFYFAILLQPLDDISMFAFRVIILMPFILFAICLFSQQHLFFDLFKKIQKQPKLIVILLLLTANTGIQLWIFLWAPNHGQALEVSIGYLLLPIVSASLGRWVFREHFSRLKWWALFFAVLGVVINIILTASFSWATVVTAIGYPVYIALRRYCQINHLATFFVELTLLSPLAFYLISQLDLHDIIAENHLLYFYLALFGLVNGMAFILFIYSSNLLPINVLGLLGYSEPLVMLFISFAIGEVLDSKSYILMVCLTLAILLLTLDSFKQGTNYERH